MNTHYILIDFENVQPATLKMLNPEHVKVLVFVGAKQKLAIDLVASIQQMGERAEYVKVSGDGPNALDFHIAFYIGQLAAKEPGAYFHIVSKDTGFDPLIMHLAGRQIAVRRVTDMDGLISPKEPKAEAARPAAENGSGPGPKPAGQDSERIALIVTHLKKFAKVMPRTVQALKNTINTPFSNKLSESELDAIIQELRRRHYISVDSDQKVSYKLPA